jgi:predicted RND superfamily exporter protein
LPILVLALGIDDSLHALHRYKEERGLGRSTERSGEVTLARVGRAIMLTSVTTIAAFAANIFRDIAALRSFGIEAALGIFAAFMLTGIWVPLIRISVDEWMEKRGKTSMPEVKKHLIKKELLPKVMGNLN